MKTKNHLKLGDRGEQIAERYLKRKGYDIIERKYRFRRYEIDLIAAKGDWTIFVEVKTRTGQKFGMPETFVSDSKIRCMQKVAAHYRSGHYSRFWRYDIIAVTLEENTTRVRHFEDAIWA